MADESVNYGLDKELREKQLAKYDVGLEKMVTEWIEAVTGEHKGDAPIGEWLKNGQVLCAVANAVKPGIVKKVNTSSMPFKQMENITFFMNAAREIGVPESAMFGTPDLYEGKNLGSVVSCIYTLGGAIQVNCPEFTGPKLGVPMNVAGTSKKRETGAVTQSGGLAGTMEVERPKERADYCVRNVGALPEKAAGGHHHAAAVAGSGGGSAALAAAPPKVSTAPAVQEGMPNEECMYGMDKELKAKQDAKYDHALELEVTAWVEQVAGEKREDLSFAEWLKNGQVLCALVNAIKPGIVKKVNTSTMPFKQMENITFFMNAARELGVPESAMFGTPDLYEEKNIGSVVTCLYTLGGAIQVSCPEFTGPKLGVAIHVESKDKKRNSHLITDMSQGFQGTMEVARPKERADYCVKPIDRS